MRQQLSAGATLLVTARSTAPVQLWLQHTTLGALSRLADGLLQLSAAPPPVEAATQATLLLECNLECSLVVPRGTPFVLSARSMHVAASSSVDGVAGSSVVAAAAPGTCCLMLPEPCRHQPSCHCSSRAVLAV